VDEYQLEIQGLRRRLEALRQAEAEPAVIEEYEAEVRNLSALYRAATETLAAGQRDRRLPAALQALGFGDWTLTSVYGFVYEASMELPLDGRDLAGAVDETDYAASLLAAFDVPG
jgi:hypothetical protein